MTTDTALALLAEGINNGYISHADECEFYEGYACDCGIDEYRKRITALLDSGEWISVKDRLPTRMDADYDGQIMVCVDGFICIRHWTTQTDPRTRRDKWQPLPPLPKGE